MKNLLLFSSALLFACAAISAQADTVTYAVSVDTHSQAGQGGYIDFELNGGGFPAPDITATVSGFSGASLNSADLGNDMIGTSGMLPGNVTFDNQVGNDYFEALTFGNSVNFLVTLSGPGLSTTGSLPADPLASGTDFQFSFLDSSGSMALFSNDPNGTAGVIGVGTDGAPSVTTEAGTTAAATPEPGTLSLLGLGGVLVGLARKRLGHA